MENEEGSLFITVPVHESFAEFEAWFDKLNKSDFKKLIISTEETA